LGTPKTVSSMELNGAFRGIFIHIWGLPKTMREF